MASAQLLRSYLKTPFLILLVVETSVVFIMVYLSSMIRFYAGGMDAGSATDGLFDSALVIAIITAITWSIISDSRH